MLLSSELDLQSFATSYQYIHLLSLFQPYALIFSILSFAHFSRSVFHQGYSLCRMTEMSSLTVLFSCFIFPSKMITFFKADKGLY